MTRKRDLSPDKIANAAQFDEVVAGVFCSKRRTGQFNDRFETGELEYLSASAGSNGRSQRRRNIDDVVHDFDPSDDVMDWPSDFDEAGDSF